MTTRKDEVKALRDNLAQIRETIRSYDVGDSSMSPPVELTRDEETTSRRLNSLTMSSDFGRFGHHQDHALDFCEEVDQLEAIAYDLRMGLRRGERADFDRRLIAAREFVTGGNKNAIAAKETLLSICSHGVVEQVTDPPVTRQSMTSDMTRLEARLRNVESGLSTIMSMLVLIVGPEKTSAVAREIDAFERARRDE